MKKEKTIEFHTALCKAVKAIEDASQVEVVVIIRPRSATYPDIALGWGIIGGLLGFSYVMFAPALFEDWIVACTPIMAFLICYALAHIPLLTRLSVAKARLQKNVEIMARALFQKGGVGHTQAKIGVLIYCSMLEKMVFILPDRGAQLALPVEEWQLLRGEFQKIFSAKNPYETLLAQLHKAEPLFSRYLPPLSININELPDDMEVDL